MFAKDAGSRARNRRGLVRARMAGLGFSAVVGYLLAVYVIFPPPPVPEDGIPVPDVVGLSVSGAQDRLQPLGLRVGRVG